MVGIGVAALREVATVFQRLELWREASHVVPRKIEQHRVDEKENSLRIGFPKTRADDPAPGPLSTLVGEHDRPPTKKEYQGG